MGKLHEVLAVEPDLEGTFRKILKEAEVTFSKKAHHFIGSVRRYEPFAEEAKDSESFEEPVNMDTTVTEKLAYMFEHVNRYFDVVAQKDATNQSAKADVIVDEKVLLKDVPVTTLLGLQKKIGLIREVLVHVPTLNPGIEWTKTPEKGEGVWSRKNPESQFKTSKTFKSQILVEATKEFPAQIEKWQEDVNIGRYTKEEWCGMMTPAQKSEMLGRCDALLRGVKEARQRANATEVTPMSIGKVMTDFILG
jgi:hypothetical protein